MNKISLDQFQDAKLENVSSIWGGLDNGGDCECWTKDVGENCSTDPCGNPDDVVYMVCDDEVSPSGGGASR